MHVYNVQDSHSKPAHTILKEVYTPVNLNLGKIVNKLKDFIPRISMPNLQHPAHDNHKKSLNHALGDNF